MKKTILLTGATDGIGLEAAKLFVSEGHHLLVHGRNPAKLEKVERELTALNAGTVESLVADLSVMDEVAALAQSVLDQHKQLDVLINNAGVFNTKEPITSAGLDVRFVVNTIAPYLLTQRLLPLLGSNGRVINLSSAAQAPVDAEALLGNVRLSDQAAYAQSKLAITMWSSALAATIGADGPAVIAVNPGSLLGSKMVKEAFGIDGGDLGKGAAILRRAALDDEFATATGRYFDNDSGQFAPPHPDALDPVACQQIARLVDSVAADSMRR